MNGRLIYPSLFVPESFAGAGALVRFNARVDVDKVMQAHSSPNKTKMIVKGFKFAVIWQEVAGRDRAGQTERGIV